MKLTRTLNAPISKVDAFIYELASKDAGRPAKSGLAYTKKVTGMNGASQSTTVTIQALESGRYAVVFQGANGSTEMEYLYRETEPGTVELVYEEKAAADNAAGKVNQMVGSLLFNRTIRKQINARLDAFARQLEGYQWPD